MNPEVPHPAIPPAALKLMAILAYPDDEQR